MLEVENLVVRQQNFCLRANFSIRKGEKVAIIGINAIWDQEERLCHRGACRMYGKFDAGSGKMMETETLAETHHGPGVRLITAKTESEVGNAGGSSKMETISRARHRSGAQNERTTLETTKKKQ